MTSTNLFIRLQALQAEPPLLTGQILADMGGGMARVELPGGGVLSVRNPMALAVAQWVFLQGDVISGPAPDLPYIRIEI
jgi:hypothetical protein